MNVPELALSAAQAADVEARFDAILRFAASRTIADIALKPSQRPLYRRFGQLIFKRDDPTFGVDELAAIVAQWMPSHAREEYDRCGHATFMVTLVACGRFRITALQSRGAPSLAVRVVSSRVLNLRELNLPRLLTTWAMVPHGLVLVSAGPGGGKSATWAGLLEHVNTASPQTRQVITLESPIEQTFADKVAFVHQRELGSDTLDVPSGVASALRQAPDVFGVDGATGADLPSLAALAELPILVVASLSAGGVVDAVRQFVLAVPESDRGQMRLRLARRLRGVVHLALVPTVDGKGLVPACELLHVTPQIAEILRSDKDLESLQAIIEAPAQRAFGMCGLDQALLELAQATTVAPEAAVALARDSDGIKGRLAAIRRPTKHISGQTALTDPKF